MYIDFLTIFLGNKWILLYELKFNIVYLIWALHRTITILDVIYIKRYVLNNSIPFNSILCVNRFFYWFCKRSFGEFDQISFSQNLLIVRARPILVALTYSCINVSYLFVASFSAAIARSFSETAISLASRRPLFSLSYISFVEDFSLSISAFVLVLISSISSRSLASYSVLYWSLN